MAYKINDDCLNCGSCQEEKAFDRYINLIRILE